MISLGPQEFDSMKKIIYILFFKYVKNYSRNIIVVPKINLESIKVNKLFHRH